MALLHSMQALCKATALQLAVLVVLVTATEAGKPKLIVIGDSYSDIGNGVNNVVNADLSTDQVLMECQCYTKRVERSESSSRGRNETAVTRPRVRFHG